MNIVRPITTIRQELEQAKLDLMLTEQTPNVSILSARVSRLTAEALIDESKKGALANALVELRNAEDAHDKRSITKVRIPQLEAELAEAENTERLARIAEADRALQAAISEYRAAQFATARAYRRVMNAAARSSATPGAGRYQSDLRLHLPACTPQSWQGNTGQIMADGELPWETDERKQAA